ncbi:MAG: sigma-70 family RNA polymerase sigma factor [Actinomycetota bacterium]|nr:sigma-70 family RNA polymerase sigma factor [Actinomycetota bacterium]
MVERHGPLLLRIARQYSLCADDAQDAYQRALEIYLRRVESLDPLTEVPWLKVVVRNEALAVRRSRQETVTGEEVDFDAQPRLGQRSIEERFESTERVARSAEVMRRLKPDEAKALMLKAEGLSYAEIGARLNWTYTKVNRCITEGRRRFRRLYEQLENGAECERLSPTLLALAHGTATNEAVLEIRPHLRNCTACRATVRKLHASRWQRLAAFLPISTVVTPVRGWFERLNGSGSAQPPPDPEQLHPLERKQELDELFRRLNGGEAAAQPAVPAAVEQAGRLSTARVNLRAYLETALQRLQSSDVALGIHATSTGGGRAASVAALIGLCVSGVGAGTYCVATAFLPDPKPAVQTDAGPAKRNTASVQSNVVRDPASATSAATSTSDRTPRPGRRIPSPARSSSTTPVSHEEPPVSPARAGTQDFSFEQSASRQPSQPAAAPATGGGEFAP